ncbi:AEC family transporter [bacterium 210820-DFI.6.37]|nr:AEC family transporter [bacterium 210820-DFI.6.37]
MAVILTKIVIIFAIAGVGFAANKLNVLPDESNRYLIALLINITSPCMLITSITSKELTSATFTATLQVLIGTVIFFLVGMALSYVIVKSMKAPVLDQGVYMIILTTVNTGFMGFPITKAAFGNEGLYFMAISNIVLNMYLYSLGILQLNTGSRTFKGVASTLKPMLNPCAISALVGIIMLFAGLRLPSALNDFLVMIGDVTIPLSMIVVGVQLGGSRFRQVIHNHRLFAISLISLIIWPLLTFLAVNWLPLQMMSKLTLTYAAAFPCAVIIVALAAQEGKNAQLAAEGVALTTLLSMGTLPIITMLLTAYFGV